MAKAEALKKITSFPRPGFEDKIRDVRYLVGDYRFLVTFDSGKEYSFARSLLECDDGTDLVTVRVDKKRYFFHVAQASGNRYEVPWDRVLYEDEESYLHFRRRGVRITGHQGVGRKIRELRNAKGMTQGQLARAAGMMRPNLTRIEAGKHRPTIETLERIAVTLKVSVVDLIISR
ncbi:MAG: helix-turn-helix transcriptional regulator [Candidatus Binatia bacterium]